MLTYGYYVSFEFRFNLLKCHLNLLLRNGLTINSNSKILRGAGGQSFCNTTLSNSDKKYFTRRVEINLNINGHLTKGTKFKQDGKEILFEEEVQKYHD